MTGARLSVGRLSLRAAMGLLQTVCRFVGPQGEGKTQDLQLATA